MAETVLSDYLRTLAHLLAANILVDSKALTVELEQPSSEIVKRELPTIGIQFIDVLRDPSRATGDRQVVKDEGAGTGVVRGPLIPVNFTTYINIVTKSTQVIYSLDIVQQLLTYFEDSPHFELENYTGRQVILSALKPFRTIGSAEDIIHRQMEVIAKTHIARVEYEDVKLVTLPPVYNLTNV